ncbi:Predicted nucleic acid-binding protein, contains PIN domain [Geodermatophilus saharensis]|uniref:Ribonuclease VapC n=1 Tax=Geodermatophilus saharensis TaxID=1137994 RepID=A0A239BH21_9ACTN|nr:type II toxin-antitoxin system VapC family toxin [Geodermatophilus saharensis]SNS07250.1 Predicted nucleic acid-binding protein, contains PIN domain [Geodermatophilus saharensis]
MIVVDCAAVVDVLTGVEGSDRLRARLAVEDLHAPALLDYEVVSALRHLVLRGSLSASRGAAALADFEDLALERWPALGALRRRAWTLRENVSAYDAAYVALAEALQCPLLTRDARLARTPGHEVRVEVV